MEQTQSLLPLTPERIAYLYPKLFSEKRFDEWLELFDGRAILVKAEKGRPVSCMNIMDVMDEQREYAAENATFLETWHKLEIRIYGSVAILSADYVLTTDHEIRKGVDILTLCSDERGWLIYNLTYEQKELITL
ncbi:MAG TPA: hypothetical protein PLB14_08150 [Smithellaceae bacterium]|jgi:hypothetical protein|nr:hypothetical protein [Syntrophaceae bacterium]HPV49664.1 hypothetical protein [Smithellaceae bacterium]